MAYEGPHSWKDAALSHLGYIYLSSASSVSRMSLAGARSAAPGRAPLWLPPIFARPPYLFPYIPFIVWFVQLYSAHTSPENINHGPLYWIRGLLFDQQKLSEVQMDRL